MIIYPARRVVLLWPHESDAVRAAIPFTNAREITYKDQQVLAVRHGVDESRVMRNLGIDVRSPILDYYNWPCSQRITPFENQKITAAFFTMHFRGHCHNGMGSGKSLATLWAYDYLRSQGLARKLLVIATLSSLNTTWGDSIEEHLPHLRYAVLHGTKKKRLALLEFPADVYIINHDGVEILKDELRQREDIDVVAIDEIADCARNAGTATWRALDSVINASEYRTVNDSRRRFKSKDTPKKWVWGLTGTPIPNEPVDAYAQAKLITPEKAPARMTWFRNETMVQVSQFRWRAKSKVKGDDVDALDVVYKVLSPSIRFSLEDCVDLPPTTFIHRHTPLTKQQQKAYDEMRASLVTETDDGKVSAANEGVKASKLVQIACGVARLPDGKPALFDAEPRMAETLSLVKASASKSIVLVPFVFAITQVADYLRKAGLSVEIVYGAVTKRDRDRIFGLFQNTPDPHVLVCQPEVMAHSLTLTAASTSIWYAPYTKASIFEQANCRTPRPGQKLKTLIAMIGGTPIERMMYQRLKDKQTMQGVLLEMIRGTKA